jgi:NADH:ubiquinone oxidoreductase subunit 3 (subunit A)
MNLLSPVPALLITSLLALGLYVLFGSQRARSTHEEGKTETYLCGEPEESLTPKDRQPSLQPEYRMFFATAFLFTIMEVGALLLGTIPKGHGYFLPLGFLGLMLASVGAILSEVFQSR